MSDSSYTAMNEVVENTGSTARDHLANERTFLAWCGQAMNFMGAGIALFSSYELLDDQGARKDDEERDAISGGWKVIEPAGLMILNSAIVVTYATWNYFRVQKCLSRGNFPQNKIGVTSIVLATGTSSLLALYLMASERDIVLDHIREAREKAILQKRSTVSCKAQATVKQQQQQQQQQQKEDEQRKHQKLQVGKFDRPH